MAGMSFATLSSYSQTTVDTALELQTGENSYTFAEAGQQTVYYKYTAPEGKSQLLTLQKFIAIRYAFKYRLMALTTLLFKA